MYLNVCLYYMVLLFMTLFRHSDLIWDIQRARRRHDVLQTGASYPAASRTTSVGSSLLRAAVESRHWLASPAQGPTVPVRSRHLFFERVSSSVKIIMLFSGIQWQVVEVEVGGGQIY